MWPIFLENAIVTLASISIYRGSIHVTENEDNFTKLSRFHNYGTRNEEKLAFPKHKNVLFEISLIYQCIQSFNHLHNHVESTNLNRYKKLVRKWLLSNWYYDFNDYFLDNLSKKINKVNIIIIGYIWFQRSTQLKLHSMFVALFWNIAL